MDTILSSKTPYLIRAMHDWMTDNTLTPYITVNIRHPGVIVPDGYAVGDIIILNIAWRAIEQVNRDDDSFDFTATFNGVIEYVSIPYDAITSIYSKEIGEGMMFEPDLTSKPSPEKPEKKKPNLRLV